MTIFVDFPVRLQSCRRQNLRAAFDRRVDAGSRRFSRLSSSAAALLGVAHIDRFEMERPSLFETVSPDRH